MQNWTEKYRPLTLQDVIGNHDALVALKKWGEDWKKGSPSKKAIVLSGRPGVGKTSAALALAYDQGWEIIELNASDARNEQIIKRVALAGGLHETLGETGDYASSKTKGKKLIILDEADNLYEREGDRGGKRAIADTIKKTQQPLILIVNDYYSLIKGNSDIKRLTQEIRFTGGGNLTRLLQEICHREQVTVDPAVLKVIVDHSQGDIRAAVNDLQSLCQGRRHVTQDLLPQLASRDRELELFRGIREILKARDMKRARKTTSELGEAPDFLLLWIDENLPREYRDGRDLARGYRYLSQADVYLGRVRKRQHYHLWAYATDLMGGGVAVAKKRFYPGFVRYGFPTWLTGMSRSKDTRQTRDSIAKKLGFHCHVSKLKAREILPSVSWLFKNNREFAVLMATHLSLTESEVAYLVEKDTHKTKGILEDMKKQETLKQSGDLRDMSPEKKPRQHQQSLQDF